MSKSKTPTNGRPPSPFPDRFPVRLAPEHRVRWNIAAATSGLTLQDWIRATLDAEAKRPTHVPILRRKGA